MDHQERKLFEEIRSLVMTTASDLADAVTGLGTAITDLQTAANDLSTYVQSLQAGSTGDTVPDTAIESAVTSLNNMATALSGVATTLAGLIPAGATVTPITPPNPPDASGVVNDPTPTAPPLGPVTTAALAAGGTLNDDKSVTMPNGTIVQPGS